MPVVFGALLEYGIDFLGPIPNVVVFQFNPETLTRNLSIPPRPVDATQRETSQAGEPAFERFTVEATFSAADQRSAADPVGLAYGVGPQLAALQAMVYPLPSPAPPKTDMDPVGSQLQPQGPAPTQPIPRLQTPRLLFIWGRERIVPVIIESLTMNEQIYDNNLNPIEAQVTIGLAVITPNACSEDTIGQGALAWTQMNQATMTAANLARNASAVTHLIPF